MSSRVVPPLNVTVPPSSRFGYLSVLALKELFIKTLKQLQVMSLINQIKKKKKNNCLPRRMLNEMAVALM